MEQFQIYCTPEQTKKAYELGAPIGKCVKDNNDPDLTVDGWGSFDGYWLLIPTAEQMFGWLRSQGFRFLMKDLKESTHWDVTMEVWIDDGELQTPKEATLAAIDAALEYLLTNKK